MNAIHNTAVQRHANRAGVIIGTLSGITGGILRDALTGQPPGVFTGQFCALAAIAGTAFYTLLIRTSVNLPLAWFGGHRGPVPTARGFRHSWG